MRPATSNVAITGDALNGVNWKRNAFAFANARAVGIALRENRASLSLEPPRCCERQPSSRQFSSAAQASYRDHGSSQVCSGRQTGQSPVPIRSNLLKPDSPPSDVRVVEEHGATRPRIAKAVELERRLVSQGGKAVVKDRVP